MNINIEPVELKQYAYLKQTKTYTLPV